MKTGDRVKISDEKGTYTVVRKISSREVLVSTDDGLEFPLLRENLIVVSGENEKLYRKITSLKKGNEKAPGKKTGKKIKKKNIREVDLHLRSGTSGGDYHVIELQILRFRAEMDRAIKKKEKEIIFIHGAGSGKLKEMIRRILTENYSGCTFYDGSYSKYGVDGATHVSIGRFN